MTDEYGDSDETADTAATTGEPSDAELISAVRVGAALAFDVLYRRHLESAQRMARSLVRHPSDVDDLVAESFARMLSIVSGGGGPVSAFRAYLLTIMRNLFHERRKHEHRVQVMDDLEAHEPGAPFVDTAVEELELSFVSRAFARLPERWQTVLWHTEVEQEPPAMVATLLGISPNGVAALAYRAREGLRQAYLQEHIAADPGEECRWTTERLGAYVRDGLSRRDHAKVDAHLSDCRRCQVLFMELGEVNSRLREALATAVLAGSASGYLASGTGTTASAGAVLIGARRIIRRRSTQVVAAAVVLAAMLAGAGYVFVSQSKLTQPPAAARGPEVIQPAPPAGAPSTSPDTSPSVTPSQSVPSGSAALDASLEPVGTLARGRPGVLALTVANRGIPAQTVAFGPRARPIRAQQTADTGPLTAVLSVPSGVTLRAGAPGDGWQCAPSGSTISCNRSTLPSGKSTRAFVPVDVSPSAVDGELRVQLTAPRAGATSAARAGTIQASGLTAAFAATVPATVVTGGNRLLDCANLVLLGCLGGGPDNGDIFMDGYRDKGAPSGEPRGASVSGAVIPVPGEVLWAGLYWSGTGAPPAKPVAHLRVPGASQYAAVPATRLNQLGANDFNQPAFQASADVTGLVRGTPGGVWWVAVEQDFVHGYGSFGGWALVMVVKDAGPTRTVAVLDGFVPVRGQAVTTPLFGVAGGQARIGFVAWEGDRSLMGDQIKLAGQPLGGNLSGNIASSITDGTPAGWNTYGIDARVLEGQLPSTPGQLAVTAATTDDAWILGAIAISSAAP